MRVDQLLHGYSDGHRLLAASKELPRAARHAMLTLSDMSGRSIVPGFEEYLTAYPVPEADSYAFARTWYAPEMERPGCVWTHTFIIASRDLDAIDDLAALQSQFRRPVKGNAIDFYTWPIEITSASELRPNHLPDELALAALSGLYGTPDSPVVLPVFSATTHEQLALAIWNQQWAKLRSTFSFCTGSISSRSLMGRPFDLQLVPANTVREIRRELANAVIVDFASPPSDASATEWLPLALNDLVEPNPALRRSLREFGPSFECALGGRAAFEPLLQFVMSNASADSHADSLEDLVERIALRFSSLEAARRLKAALVGADAALTRVLFPDRTEMDVLTVMATTPHPEAFDRSDLQVEKRVTTLWSRHRDQAEQLVDHLLSRNHNVFGEVMLASVLSAVSAADVTTLFGGRPSVLVSAVRRDPTIAMSPGIWTGQPDTQRELFDAATAGREVNSEAIDGIVAAMLAANSEVAVEQLFRRFGDPAVTAVLGWSDRNAGAPMGTEWHRGLRRHPGAVLRWLSLKAQPSVHMLALAAHVLDPHSAETHSAGLDFWQTAIGQDSGLTEETRIQLHSFVLALAFDFSTNQACELTVGTFETVHEAAATKNLSYKAWSRFEQIVPYLSVSRNWDHCERLRRGLVDRFVEHDWPVAQFIGCARTQRTLAALVRTCNQYSPMGKSILRRMRQQEGAIRALVPYQWWQEIRYYL